MSMKNSSDTIGNSAVSLLKALNTLYLAVDDYSYDYMHNVYDLYRAL
jgi:hypothetical protein